MSQAVYPNTEALRNKDKTHFLHPWQHFDSMKQDGALVIANSEGAYIYDNDGQRYLDGLGGMWCVNVGYGRDELADVMAEQARKLPYASTFGDTTNPPAAELAEKLAQLAPGSINHVIFSSSGSAANDSAIRLVHYYQGRRGKPEKKHIISRKHAYHGSTYLGSSLSGAVDKDSDHFQYINDIIHHISAPDVYRRPQGISISGFCDDLVQEFIHKVAELGPENVAAFVAEPILGSGGVMVPPDGYLQRIHEHCQANDILFIADEVVTAFGRLGHMFASKDYFGIQSDIILSAKGITSGYIPLAATLFSDEIFDVISAPDPDACFAHGFTYSGHPVACAVALKNIEIMEREDLCGHVQRVGPYFAERLQTLRDLPLVGDVRGTGFMHCIEYVADKQTKALLPDEIGISKRIADACEARGVMVRPVWHLNILSPPLVMSKAQIDHLIDVLRDSVISVAADLDHNRSAGDTTT